MYKDKFHSCSLKLFKQFVFKVFFAIYIAFLLFIMALFLDKDIFPEDYGQLLISTEFPI